MRYTPRLKESELRQFLQSNQEHKPVLIVSGARQVGKSTLIDHVLTQGKKKFIKIDLEKYPSFAEKIDRTIDFQEFEGLLADEYSFSSSEGTALFIDESQISKKLGTYVRFMKESWNRSSVILSGSLIGELHNEDVRRPVGREKFLEIWPFSFKEFLSALGHDSLVKVISDFHIGGTISELVHQRLIEDLDIYLKIGGLPAVISAYKNGENWQDALLDIYKTYEDDFVRYFGIENTNLFGRALSAVAVYAGSPSKNSHVIKIDAPGYKKIAGVLARLELWQLVIKVAQLGKTPEQFNFPPKRYLYDIGMLNILRFKGRPDFKVSELADPFIKTAMGGLIENAVVISLRNQAREIVGIKLSKNSEIDFGMKFDDLFVPIECKAAKSFKIQHAFAVLNYCKMFGLKRGIVINFGAPVVAEKNGINICSLPIYLTDEILRLMKEDNV